MPKVDSKIPARHLLQVTGSQTGRKLLGPERPMGAGSSEGRDMAKHLTFHSHLLVRLSCFFYLNIIYIIKQVVSKGTMKEHNSKDCFKNRLHNTFLKIIAW